MTREDYHLAFSPGTDCKDPKVFCLNKNTEVPGARLHAQPTTNGYILEGSIPLDFLEGLKLGPGKSIGLALALNAGGELSGYRTLRMIYGGNTVDPEDPGSWPVVQWTGSAVVDVPFKTTLDLNSGLVADGTKGTTFLGIREISGQVLGPEQKPLEGAQVSTWPKVKETATDSKGHFTLLKGKLYSKTVIYARKKGFVSAVGQLPAKGKGVTLILEPNPSALSSHKGTMGPFFMGAVLPAMAPVSFDAFLAQERPLIEPLHLGVLRLAAPVSFMSEEDHLKVIHSFETFTRGLGAEPMVNLTLEGYSTALAYFKAMPLGSKTGPAVRFWALGDEQDLFPTSGSDQNNSYTYLNQFRSIANEIKSQDPGLLIWGPETGGDSANGEADWITPLLKYDGDVVNGVSFHRYGWGQGVTLTSQKVQDSLRHEIDTLVGLEDRVSENSDLDLPCAITGGAAQRSSKAAVTPETRMLQALWEADQRGIYLKGGLSMFLAGEGVWADPKGPSYWALRLWSRMKRGKLLSAVSQDSLVSVYATQDPGTKDVTLMLVNKNDHYWKPKIRLNGEDDEVTVEAGLDQRYDFECPSLSVSLLEIKADRSPGNSWVLDQDSVKNGAPPRTNPLKPW